LTASVAYKGMQTTTELLTPADVALRCQVSTKTVLRAIHRGRLRASRLGARGAYRIRVDDMEQWIAGSAITPRRHRPDSDPPSSTAAVSAAAVVDGGRLVVTEQMGRR
jgi:excisionase family DNA binding protein